MVVFLTQWFPQGNVLKVDSFLIIVHYSRTRSVFSSSFFSCFSRCLFKHVFDQKKNAHRLPDVSRLCIHYCKRRNITSRTPCIRKFPEKQLQFLEKKNLCLSDPISLVDVVLYLVGLYLKKVDVLSKNKVLFFFTVSGSVAVTIGA